MNKAQQQQVDLFYHMLRIRLVEEAIVEAYPHQKMRTPVHLSIGQEAVAAACALALQKTDYAVSGHRAHAHYLAKGGDLNAMIAELHGKVTGCCRGRGGSMHLIDQSVGFMGSTAIVANTIPIGVGLGLAIQLNQSKQASCIFIGDAAVEEGVFYESLNFAVLKKLPVLFICENNLYSVYSPLHKRQPLGRKIHEFVQAMGAFSTLVEDGYDVMQCFQTISQSVEKVRCGGVVHFVEIYTYPWREHCGPNFDNDLGYRSVEEYNSWRARDSIEHFKKILIKNFQLNENFFSDLTKKIQLEIQTAFDFAEESVFPDAIEAIAGQYATMLSRETVSCAG